MMKTSDFSSLMAGSVSKCKSATGEASAIPPTKNLPPFAMLEADRNENG
jgi:hypothetical protein